MENIGKGDAGRGKPFSRTPKGAPGAAALLVVLLAIWGAIKIAAWFAAR